MYQSATPTFDVASPSAAGAAAQSRGKRLIDICGASALLLLLLPLLIAIGIAIRLGSEGSALFRQRRGGIGGRPFTILKFRTMTVAEDGDRVSQAKPGDERVTAIGAVLRKTSLDELPQLLNVLRGEMSLVGPRPHALAHDREFNRLVPSYGRRFAVKPGITGLAQVRGFRGETLNLNDIAQRVAADIEYIETWTLAKDLGLLAATLKVPLEADAY
jgi:putative colanic acid biosynthesis UDP-glucose lipid carrier transferase